MALLESIKIPLGSQMPAFELADPSGKSYNSADFFQGDGQGLMVIFTCNHCPYALAVWPRTIQLAQYAQTLNIAAVFINPNINPDYPEDSPRRMKEKIEELGLKFPYLIDESQETAQAFKAQCTPDIYLFDADQKLVYHGRIDDNWQDESKVTKQELKEAITALANSQPISPDQKPSMGCSIKWI